MTLRPGPKHIVEAKLKAFSNRVLSEFDTAAETCSLDVADRGGLDSLEEIAEMMGMSRERVRQVMAAGVQKLRAAMLDDLDQLKEIFGEVISNSVTI